MYCTVSFCLLSFAPLGLSLVSCCLLPLTVTRVYFKPYHKRLLSIPLGFVPPYLLGTVTAPASSAISSARPDTGTETQLVAVRKSPVPVPVPVFVVTAGAVTVGTAATVGAATVDAASVTPVVFSAAAMTQRFDWHLKNVMSNNHANLCSMKESIGGQPPDAIKKLNASRAYKTK